MTSRSRGRSHAALGLFACLSWSSAVSAATPSFDDSVDATSSARERERAASQSAERLRKDWTLALAGTTHAPLDMGVQLGLETPQGIRLSAGYGWVPSAYVGLLGGIAASASGNVYAQALLNQVSYSGHDVRVQVGLRPFRALGLYADVGYARLSVQGTLALSNTGVPALEALGGAYVASTDLDLWLVELGYEARFGDRLLLALALGAAGTLNARTAITAQGGAPSSNALSSAATQADNALEAYGIVPTLTLRAGLDLL